MCVDNPMCDPAAIERYYRETEADDYEDDQIYLPEV